MSVTQITLGVEDLAGELALRRLLKGNRRLSIALVRGRQGEGFLKAQIEIGNRSAPALPLIVLVDPDRGCAPGRRDSLIRNPHPNLLLRIAVHEVESWFLADPQAMADWVGIPMAKLPAQPDLVPNPKRESVNLVQHHGSARIRRFIVPSVGDRRETSPGHNDALRDFITNQ
jgi:hypothetical protein